MSQEFIEDKQPTLNKLSNRQRLFEAGLLVIVVFAIYLLVALFSFNPADPSWSQTAWHEPVHNLGGEVGAWLADIFLFIFGLLAYPVPVLMLVQCWFLHRHQREQKSIDFFALSLRLIGLLALILSSCGLFAISIDDWHYFASGGVIGSLLYSALLPYVDSVGATLILLCVWGVGLTFFTGWSWLAIAEKIGAFTLNIVASVINRSRNAPNLSYEEKAENTAEPVQTQLDFAALTASDDALLNATAVRAGEKDRDEAAVLTPPSLGQFAVESRDESVLQRLPSDASGLAAARINSGIVNGTVSLENRYVTESSSEQPLNGDKLPLTESTQHAWNAATFTFGNVSSSDATQPPLNTENSEQSARTDLERSVYSHRTTDAPLFAASQESSKATTADWDDSDKPTEALTNAVNVHAEAASIVDRDANPVTAPIVSVKTPLPQVKEGIGPQMPRPNPVRIPTRRELASYGIKIPSQREAERRERERLAQNEPPLQPGDHAVEAQDIDAIQEAALRKAFEEDQRQRYGEKYELDDQDVNDAVSESEVSLLSPKENAIERHSASVMESENDEEDLPGAASSNASLSSVDPTSTHATMASSPSFDVAPQSESPLMDSLVHPFLMRNEAPLETPTTPLPSLDLLTSPPTSHTPINQEALTATAGLLERRLADFRVKARVVDILPGPVITRFELDLAPGVKAARISSLAKDLARSLSVVAVRVVEVIPGKPYVGLELPNEHRQTVYMREVLNSPAFSQAASPLTVVLGKDIAGQSVVADLAKMPHLLVAGTTGSGKSVGVNAMILSMLYKSKPEDVRFIMIDPKMLELSVYEGIPHLLTEVVTDMKDAANALRWCVGEMERRYKLMSALGVRNLAGYNERVQEAEQLGRPVPDPLWKSGDSMAISPPALEKLPYIVVMVDEFADLMMAVGKKVEELIARLAQKARAAGIHLVLATQRPSVDVITGLIKANIPTRIAFTVSSKIDSRTILDQGGAESLLGMGDMLYLPPNSSVPVRVHGAFVRDQEVHAVVQDWKARGRPEYIDNITTAAEDGDSQLGMESGEALDPLFDQAVAFVIEKKKPSISGIQRQFRIGYNRAARIVDQMEAQGIVSPPGHNGNREVLARSPFD